MGWRVAGSHDAPKEGIKGKPEDGSPERFFGRDKGWDRGELRTGAGVD
jgi:hypothetical protein